MSEFDEFAAALKCFDCGESLLRDVPPLLGKTTFPVWEGDGNAVCSDCMRARMRAVKLHFELRVKQEEGTEL